MAIKLVTYFKKDPCRLTLTRPPCGMITATTTAVAAATTTTVAARTVTVTATTAATVTQ